MFNSGSPYLPGAIDGTRRVVIRDVGPQISDGEYPVKRIMEDVVKVTAIAFADSHDAIACQVLYRHADETAWRTESLEHTGNDAWSGAFKVTRLGVYEFTVQGWVDRFASWHRDLVKRKTAKQNLRMPLLAGAILVSEATQRAQGGDIEILSQCAIDMRDLAESDALEEYSCPAGLVELMARYPDLRFASTYNRLLNISVDRARGQYSTWYEMFPRSAGPNVGQHGTFQDCEKAIPLIAGLGFDVLYLPPIHPIGDAFRKGRDNSTTAIPGDVGSPWAIGSSAGGHKAIHPELGSLADFVSLLHAAKKHGIEVALDIAFQCSPDHPYVKEHPEWFLTRPDGSIQYAENPPKKYQDIYPLNFETSSWWDLWNELKSVFVYWIEHGVRIFRVDNPHTKAFPFWKWIIPELKKIAPETLFLAEAFTRPNPMYELAMLGFSQSYTYFTWRNNKDEIISYFTELNTEPVKEFFRPNLWPNTPDILPFGLQNAPESRFAVRLILAATLSASYGIYGSAYEVCDNVPKDAGSEEYSYSEKYELKQWSPDPEVGLRPLIRKINDIRAKNAALQANSGLHFHETGGPSVLAYSKSDFGSANVILVVIDLDPGEPKQTKVTLDKSALGTGASHGFILHDLLSKNDITVDAESILISLDVNAPACIYRVEEVG